MHRFLSVFRFELAERSYTPRKIIKSLTERENRRYQDTLAMKSQTEYRSISPTVSISLKEFQCNASWVCSDLKTLPELSYTPRKIIKSEGTNWIKNQRQRSISPTVLISLKEFLCIAFLSVFRFEDTQNLNQTDKKNKSSCFTCSYFIVEGKTKDG